MAGIYFHIPFCRKACAYCNFHFSTSLKAKQNVLAVMAKEMAERQNYLQGQQVQTIYFGGGTPSLLNKEELLFLLTTLKTIFSVAPDVEITLEANPDDLGPEKLSELKAAGINRLSIGVQSFRQQDLEFLGRIHSAEQAKKSLQSAQAAGFTNITIDLIYGIPGLSDEAWLQNLQTVTELGLPHLSSYALTIEPHTLFHNMIKTGKIAAPSDDQAANQFDLLTKWAVQNNFDHYEISNLAHNGFYSKHNTSYWLNKYYLGIGPSAHSFNGYSRQWNIANNNIYVKNFHNGLPYFEVEQLSLSDRVNDYLLTRLRTKWGADTSFIEAEFGASILRQIMADARHEIKRGNLQLINKKLLLTPQGMFFADGIIASLFIT